MSILQLHRKTVLPRCALYFLPPSYPSFRDCRKPLATLFQSTPTNVLIPSFPSTFMISLPFLISTKSAIWLGHNRPSVLLALEWRERVRIRRTNDSLWRRAESKRRGLFVSRKIGRVAGSRFSQSLGQTFYMGGSVYRKCSGPVRVVWAPTTAGVTTRLWPTHSALSRPTYSETTPDARVTRERELSLLPRGSPQLSLLIPLSTISSFFLPLLITIC